jgi:hypothetical protein
LRGPHCAQRSRTPRLKTRPNTNDDYTLPNLAGWVLAWVGLWYPLDTILFSSVLPKRENAVLARLQEAEVAISPL